MGNFIIYNQTRIAMKKRMIEESIFLLLMRISTIVVIGSMLLIVLTILVKGLPAMSIDMITKTPEGGYYIGKEGGILNAIVGSLVLGILASVLAFVVSLFIVFYINIVLPKDSRFALAVRFSLDILFGIPSIVYGAFGFAIMMMLGAQSSLIAAILVVAALILPIMCRSIDEVVKLSSFELKEASYAIGATNLETGINVIIRQSYPGLITAFLVAFGRGIGDAASVLFTGGFSDSLPYSFFKPVATLPLAIFFQLATPFPEVQQRGYASALILTIIILSVSIISRLSIKKFYKKIIK